MALSCSRSDIACTREEGAVATATPGLPKSEGRRRLGLSLGMRESKGDAPRGGDDGRCRDLAGVPEPEADDDDSRARN